MRDRATRRLVREPSFAIRSARERLRETGDRRCELAHGSVDDVGDRLDRFDPSGDLPGERDAGFEVALEVDRADAGTELQHRIAVTALEACRARRAERAQ